MPITHHRIQRIRLRDVSPAHYNPRVELEPGDPTHDALEASLQRFGVVEPLVVNERTGRLVGGHQRLNVLLRAGEAEADAVIVDLSDEDEKALNLALNKIDGRWDEEKLATLLDELLDSESLDIEVTGFDFDEAEDLIDSVLGDPDEDREEDFDAEAELDRIGEPVTKPGDLIQLGSDPETAHRLICGDCTDESIVHRLLEGERASLMATDPPYFVGIDPEWDKADGDTSLYERALRLATETALVPHAAVYVWHASRTQAAVESAMRAVGMLVHCQIVWVKPTAAPSRSFYRWRHELCFMGWREGHRPKRCGGESLTTVWELPGVRGSDRPDHPTPKPLEAFEIPMRQHTRAGDACYEPFAGSGTQFIAAERLGRRCLGVEISPRYCDLIVRRFIAFAGVDSVPPDIARRYAACEATVKGATP